MKYYHISLIAVFGFAFSSCSIRQKTNENGIVFKNTKNIYASDSVSLEQYEIYNPTHIVASKELLWIVLGEGVDKRVCLFDNKCRYKAKGIGVGQGPDEILEITSVHGSSNGTIVYDARKGVLSNLEYENNVIQIVPTKSRLLLYDDACALPDSNMLVIPITKKYNYALINNQGNIIDSLRYTPSKPDNNISDFTHSLACTGRTAILSSKKRFARTIVYDGAIDFFGFDNNVLKHLLRQEEFGMDYDIIKAIQPVPTFSETTRVGYKSLTTSDNMFYALFSNGLYLEKDDGCDEIQSFTSDGLPHYKYKADRKLTHIAVSNDGSVVYGIGKTKDDKVTLYIYKLN